MAEAAADPFSLCGTVLDRKYRVDRLVAEGGFGVVYAGHHLALDVPVAIKVLKPSGDRGHDADELLSRFLLEAQTMAKLRHTHIVSVLDTGVAEIDGEHRSVPWMVLEWIEGETLRTHLARRRGMGGRSIEEAREIIKPVLEAIAHAHDAGVAHRDIKPSNILLARDGRGVSPRVLDFGIAKVMQGTTEAEAGSGDTKTGGKLTAFSTKYAAPEQLSGARTGPWTDVHALGLLLTELLTDRAPCDSDDPMEIYTAVFDAARPTPAKAGVDAGAWEAIISRAVALKPSDRFANARELLAELETATGREVFDREPDSVPPASDHATAEEPSDGTAHTFGTVLTGTRKQRRDRRRTLTVLGAVAALGAAGVLFARSNVSAPPARAEDPPPPRPAAAPASPPASATAPPPPSAKPPPSTTPVERPRTAAPPRPSKATSEPTASAPRPMVSSDTVPGPYVLE